MRNLHDSCGRYVMKLAGSLRRRLDSFVADTPMTPMEARVLQFVASAHSAVYQKDLEQEYGCSAATISELVHGMEQKGLLQRETDPEDRRRKRLAIPEPMRARADAMLVRMVEMEDVLVAGIAPEELDVFLEVIRRMVDRFPPNNSW